MDVTCRTVKELIEALQRLNQSAVPMAAEPPFTGVRVILQSSGKVLICTPQE